MPEIAVSKEDMLSKKAVKFVKKIAAMKLSCDLTSEEFESANFEDAYNGVIEMARKVSRGGE